MRIRDEYRQGTDQKAVILDLTLSGSKLCPVRAAYKKNENGTYVKDDDGNDVREQDPGIELGNTFAGISHVHGGIANDGRMKNYNSTNDAGKFLRADGAWAIPSYTTNTDKTAIHLKTDNTSDGTIKTDNTLLKNDSSTGLWIKGGDNKFLIGDGTNYIEVGVTPSIADNVTGSDLTSDSIIIGNGTSTVKSSGKYIATTIDNNTGKTASATTNNVKDDYIPTNKAVTTYVDAKINDTIATADAMLYKGTIAGVLRDSNNAPGALTIAADKGWTYKVSSSGFINGIAVEVGDMLICNTDSTSAATSTNFREIAAKWDIIQTNIDGAVTGPASPVVTNRVAVFDGTTGKVIKDSGYTIATSVPNNAVFTDTTYSEFTGATASADGTSGLVKGPLSTEQAKFLKGDGTWGTPTDTTYNLTLNGKINGTFSGTSLGSFYAPTSVTGQANKILAVNSGATGIEWVTKPTSNVTSHLIAGTADATANGNQYTTNDTTYLNLIEGSTKESGVKIKGSGSVSVKANNGEIIITGTDTNTTYSTATSSSEGIVKVGDNLSNVTGYTACKIKDGIIYYSNTASSIATTTLTCTPTLKKSGWTSVTTFGLGLTFPTTFGTYAIQITDTCLSSSSDSKHINYYSGIATIGATGSNRGMDEVALHSSMLEGDDTPKRIFLAIGTEASGGSCILEMTSMDEVDTQHNLTIKLARII